MLPAQRAVRALPCCNQDTQRTRSPPEVHPSSRRAGWPRRRRRRGGAWRACWVGCESWGEVGGASAWALGRSSKADVQSESFPACSDDVVLFCWSCWHACWLSNSTNTCVCRSKLGSLRTGTSEVRLFGGTIWPRATLSMTLSSSPKSPRFGIFHLYCILNRYLGKNSVKKSAH